MRFETIDRAELEQKITARKIDNRDPKEGVALVNVLGAEQFDRKHIPSSINIPIDELDQFEERFSKDKDIIVYCASHDCDASPRAAEALTDRGFRNVSDYGGGMADWEKGHQPVAGRESTPNRTPS